MNKPANIGGDAQGGRETPRGDRRTGPRGDYETGSDDHHHGGEGRCDHPLEGDGRPDRAALPKKETVNAKT